MAEAPTGRVPGMLGLSMVYEIKPGFLGTLLQRPAVAIDQALALASGNQLQNYILQLNTYAGALHFWAGGWTYRPGLEVWDTFANPPPGFMLVTWNAYPLAPGAFIYDFLPTPEAMGLASAGVVVVALWRMGVFARIAAALSGIRTWTQPAINTLVTLLAGVPI